MVFMSNIMKLWIDLFGHWKSKIEENCHFEVNTHTHTPRESDCFFFCLTLVRSMHTDEYKVIP